MPVVKVPMPKKPPSGGQPEKATTTVKLRAATHRKAKAVAAYRGLDLADYLDGIITPAVERDFGRMTDEAHGREGK